VESIAGNRSWLQPLDAAIDPSAIAINKIRPTGSGGRACDRALVAAFMFIS
jgi:hypothetical protein